MPESPRWLEARERRDEARQVVGRMEARVMKQHPVLPEPDVAPYEVVAEEKTSWLGAVRQALRVHHHLAAGGHGTRLRRHRVRRREPGFLVPVPHPRLQRRLRLRPGVLVRGGLLRRLPAQRVRRRPV